MWSTAFYFGNFLGPTLAGISVEAYGFRTTTVAFFILFCGSLIIDFIELAYNVKVSNKSVRKGYEELS